MPWDKMDEAEKRQLAKAAMKGAAQTPENLNRAMEALSSNPELVERLSRETGIAADTYAPEAAPSEIEKNVEAGLDDSREEISPTEPVDDDRAEILMMVKNGEINVQQAISMLDNAGNARSYSTKTDRVVNPVVKSMRRQ